MVRVRLFASLREAAGTGDLQLPLEKASSAREVFEELARLHPGLHSLAGVTLVAVNEAYSDWDAVVRPGDEVAFFPPVSGGQR